MKFSGYAKSALFSGVVISIALTLLSANRFLRLPRNANSQNLSEFFAATEPNQPTFASRAELISEMRELGFVSNSSSEWYVAPDGNSAGRGTFDSPVDLASAFRDGKKSKIKPGDVIWLRGGRYVGSFTVGLNGTSTAPIHVRQYPGERAVLDKSSANRETATIIVRGSHIWFWDFEVMNSFPNRASLDRDGKLNPWRGSGINVWAPNTRYINLIVHDNGHGFGIWNEGGGTEIYGCLIFNNGNNKKEHGIYAHNKTRTQTISNNIIFNNSGYGLHVYADSDKSSIDGFNIESNAVFNNGALTAEGQVADQILVGGVSGVSSRRILLRENVIFNERKSPTGKNRGVRLGYEDKGNEDVKLFNNYIVSKVPLKILWWRSVEAIGNTIISNGNNMEIAAPDDIDAKTYRLESNTLLTGEKIANRVFVKPSRYEQGRANIIIHGDSTVGYVTVKLDGVLKKGDAFEIRDAQNYFGSPVLRGVFEGGDVRLPMRSDKTTPTIGKTERSPSHTSSEFAVFVVGKIVER